MFESLTAGELIWKFRQPHVPPGERVSIAGVRMTRGRETHPHQLVVPSELREHFELADIRVGDRSQLISPLAIPTSVFSEKSGIRLHIEVAREDEVLTLVVVNRSNAPCEFRAEMRAPLS